MKRILAIIICVLLAAQSANAQLLWEIFKEQMIGYEYDYFVSVRNQNWEKQMKELIPVQSSLFIVGAGHLSGEKGIINLLKKAGFKVTPINPV